MNCECQGWARSIDLKAITNHHPRCTRYNESLIEVFKVSDGGSSFYCETEEEAREAASNDEADGVTGLVVTKEKMHREVFEHLPEFEGF